MKDRERTRRRIALVVIGAVLVIFIILSAASFDASRQRFAPETFSFQGRNAVEGKRVFQAYNCMGCHTLLGNGAYFAPDITKVYAENGPAWLETWLAAPNQWPTQTALNLWVTRLKQSGDLDMSLDEYYATFPDVLEAVARLGGRATAMPNLSFKPDEIAALIAFLDYTSTVDTQGWPPEPEADATIVERVKTSFGMAPAATSTSPATMTTTATTSAPVPNTPSALAVQGQMLAQTLGCTACHSPSGLTIVGPTWKGLAGSVVPLQDGTTVVADDAYLRESILAPGAKVVRGFQSGIMPAFEGMVTSGQVDSLIAYIKSLK